MSTSARIAVLPAGATELVVETVDLRDPAPHEVVVANFASGVCHSQLHQIHGSRTDDLVLGHEAVSVVEAVGSAVSHVQPGDTVLVTWMPRTRERDREPQRSHVERSGGRSASTHNIYAWSSHSVVDELYVVAAPSGTPRDVSSIIGCAVMTGAGAVLNAAEVLAGETVAVWGAGGVGLSAVAAARASAAGLVVAVDIAADKLELARAMGAHEVVDASSTDAAARVRELTGATAGVDFAIDCIGRPESVRGCLAAIRSAPMGRGSGGTAVVVGMPPSKLEIDGGDLMVGQKRLIGTLGGDCTPDTDFAKFVQWHQDGILDLNLLVSDRYELGDINQAVADLEAGRVSGRAIIEFPENLS